jgi:hypothetical protein
MYWANLIDSLTADGNTNIEAAFTTLARICQNSPHAVSLLTDGNVNMGSSSARAILLPLETNRGLYGTAIFTLGFGDDHNQIMLRDIALNTQGNYFYCDKAENLPQTFGSILGILRNRSIENFLNTLFVCRSNLFERRRNAVAAFDDTVAGNQPPCVVGPSVGKLCDINAKHRIAIAANKIMDVSVDTHGVTSCQ